MTAIIFNLILLALNVYSAFDKDNKYAKFNIFCAGMIVSLLIYQIHKYFIL